MLACAACGFGIDTRGEDSLSTGTDVRWAAAAVQHNAHDLRTPKHEGLYGCCCSSTQRARDGLLLFNTTRTRWAAGAVQHSAHVRWAPYKYRTALHLQDRIGDSVFLAGEGDANELYRTEIAYGRPSDETPWLPNKEMTKPCEVSDETSTNLFPHFQCQTLQCDTSTLKPRPGGSGPVA